MREIGLVIGLAVTIVFFAARASNFLTVGNWQGIAQNVAIVNGKAIPKSRIDALAQQVARLPITGGSSQ